MPVNYAEKYSEQIDERFRQASCTDIAINHDYDFDGVNKVNVYTTDTAPLNNYDMSKSGNRYGDPVELGNELQTLTLTQDKSFTFTIDRRNYDDTVMANSAGLALNRQISEVIIPTVDMYRLSVIAANADTVKLETITTDNAYSTFLDAQAVLVDKLVPVAGRVSFVVPEYYKLIKLDKNFVSVGDKAHDLAQSGVVGMLDGVNIVLIPTVYLPEDSNFLITHPIATTSPMKLSEYKQHENAPGINGWLVEGRIYYDAFVLKNKKAAIYLSKKA
jgi:hypothetical protein